MTFRRVALFLIAVSVLLISACTFPPEYVSKSDTRRKIENIMELIKNEDKNLLIDSFSPELKKNCRTKLEMEIDNMYSLLGGKIVSYDKPENCGYEVETVNSGDITLYISSPDVKNVITDSGKYFRFSVTYTVIDDENPENIGVRQILIFGGEEDKCLLNIDGES